MVTASFSASKTVCYTVFQLHILLLCYAQLTLGGKSPQSQLRNIQSVETLSNKLSDMDLSEQSWLQLICYAVCLLHSNNFR